MKLQSPYSRSPSVISGLFKGRALLLAVVRSELEKSVRGAALHYFWWLLDPLLMMLVYAFLVEVVLERGQPHYAIFLFCALLPWKMTANTLSHSVRVLRNSKEVISKIPFPRAVLPASIVFSQLVYMSSGLLALIPLMVYYGVQPRWECLFLPLVVLLQIVLTLGLAMLFSIFGAWFKDAENFSAFFLQLWFFASPALYDWTRVPEQYRPVLQFNPLVGIFEMYRALLMGRAFPPQSCLIASLVSTLFIAALGFIVFGIFEKRLPKIL